MAVVLTAVAGGPAPASGAPVPGSISGTVTDDANGAPLAARKVCAVLGEDLGSGFRCVHTDAAGNYIISDLPPGSYIVAFYGADGSFKEFYDDEKVTFTQARLVAVIAGEGVEGIDAGLTITSGSISGTVTEDETGMPVAGVLVCANTDEAYCGHRAWTEADGSYQITQVPPGDYLIDFRKSTQGQAGGFVTEYYDDALTAEDATSVTVSSDVNTSMIDASLALAGSISGMLAEDGTGEPIAERTVCASPDPSDILWRFTCDSTDANGGYTISGLGRGNYLVWFAGAGGVLAEYYDDVTAIGAATLVAVDAGEDVVGIDAGLRIESGSISGLVTDDTTGAPVAGEQVCLSYVGAGPSTGCAVTGADGSYTLSGLPPNSYQVRFGGTEYLAELFDDVLDDGSDSAIDQATWIEVGAGEAIEAVDAGLTLGAALTGTVDGPDHGALARWVSAVDLEGNWTHFAFVRDDAFSLRPLRGGHYRVALNYAMPGGRLLSRWYGGGADARSAAVVALETGQELTGIDFEAPVLGSISGTVVGASSGDVVLVSPSLHELARTSIGSDGSYAFGAVDAGSYYVAALLAGRSPQVHADGTGAPRLVVVDDATAVHAGVNITPTSGGGLSGQVTDGGGAYHAESATVELWGGDDVWLPTAHVAVESDGSYSLAGVPAGSYKVRVVSSSPTQASGWYGGVSTREAAISVEVTDGSTQTDIDLELMSAGALEVTITSSGEPVDPGEPMKVLLFRPDSPWMPSYSAVTDSGSVTFSDVVPGDYEVWVVPETGSKYAARWYGDTTVRANSPNVTVGGSPVGVTVDLPVESMVSGHVVAGGHLAGGGAVWLVSDTNRTFVPDYGVAVRRDGSFELRGVAPGAYRLLATSGDPAFGSVWLGGGADRWAAREIVVDEDGGVSGLVVTLPAA